MNGNAMPETTAKTSAQPETQDTSRAGLPEWMTRKMSDQEAWVHFGVQQLMDMSHATAKMKGWYSDPSTGAPINRNFGEVVALMHSELSEALEAHRKDLASDHLPGFSGMEEEFADLIIRVMDTAQALDLRIGPAIVLKNRYNMIREDHSLSARLSTGGKKY